MRLRWIALAVALVLVAGGAAGLVLVRPRPATTVDIVTYNDVVETLAADVRWSDLATSSPTCSPCDGHPLASLPHADGADYVVFAPDGSVLGATGDGLATHLLDAHRHGDTVMDVVRDDQVVARVAFRVPTDDQAGYLTRARWALLGPLLGVGALLAGVLWYLHRRVLRPFGQMRDFAAQVAAGNLDAPLRMDRTNTFGAFTESFDLMRSELAVARERERAADLSKRELVASLSHDLKTPVASIRATAGRLAEHLAQDGLYGADSLPGNDLAQISAQAEQIDALVANLFAASLAEAGHLEVNPVPVPSGVITDLLRVADVHRRIDWSAPGAQVPPCLVLADLVRLAQVVGNVVANSDKYAGTAMTVRYDLVRGPDGAETLTVEVADRGPGVDPAELPLITDKYFRGRLADGEPGAGLGLYLSQSFMTQMGGSLVCTDADPGLRVTLTFCLP